ncbi:hypothetical protein PVAP13_7NG019900 [Panicum virgatum]|uniref:Uncharacterized protein n=1 Tax=Panicum virgatum TaxID=38727 RepID=A0A8T0PYE3_PANVG|nr:hypothetical protein PVAP13_7NG019900 [Panicum virgatum]
MYRGPCIGPIYPTLLGFGGIQAIILSLSWYQPSLFSPWLSPRLCAAAAAHGRPAAGLLLPSPLFFASPPFVCSEPCLRCRPFRRRLVRLDPSGSPACRRRSCWGRGHRLGGAHPSAQRGSTCWGRGGRRGRRPGGALPSTRRGSRLLGVRRASLRRLPSPAQVRQQKGMTRPLLGRPFLGRCPLGFLPVGRCPLGRRWPILVVAVSAADAARAAVATAGGSAEAAASPPPWPAFGMPPLDASYAATAFRQQHVVWMPTDDAGSFQATAAAAGGTGAPRACAWRRPSPTRRSRRAARCRLAPQDLRAHAGGVRGPRGPSRAGARRAGRRAHRACRAGCRLPRRRARSVVRRHVRRAGSGCRARHTRRAGPGRRRPSSSAPASSHARRCCSPVRAVLDTARSTQPAADLAWGWD